MPEYFIGIDGGGSKTSGVLLAGDGQVLASARDAGSAIVGAPSPRSCNVLAAMKVRLCADAGIAPAAVTGIGLGLNGIDFADEFALQHTDLAACLTIAGDRLTLVNDGIAALWGASSSPQAVIVQHGTAYTHAYRAAYGQEQLFDHLDVGMAFDIRRALTALVARMIDGRAATTPLKEAALRHYGVSNDTAYAEALFRGRIPAERILTGASIAFSAWLAGDPAAIRLVEQAADDYVCTAYTLAARVNHDQCHVAFGGGVLNHAPDTFIDLLRERIQRTFPLARVMRPQLSPACGAAVMAAFHRAVDPTPLYHRLLTTSGNTQT